MIKNNNIAKCESTKEFAKNIGLDHNKTKNLIKTKGTFYEL